MSTSRDLVAKWEVELFDRKHVIEFEHGTITGRRVIWLDGKEIYRKDFMFELVGTNSFRVAKHDMVISIAAIGLIYEYELKVNGLPLDKFVQRQNVIMRMWNVESGGKEHRIALEKDTMDLWVDGVKVQSEGEFDDEGTKTHFEIEGEAAYLLAVNSGNKKDGIIHKLFFNDNEIAPSIVS